MKTTQSPDRTQPMFVPVALSALGFISGKWVTLYIESIDSNELFFSSSEYIRPWEVFQILIWLPKSTTPLYAMVTASSVERSAAAFGVAAQISTISTGTQAILDRFYLKAVAASRPRHGEALRTAQLLKRRHVVTLELALPGSVLAMLQHHGVRVQTVSTPAEALKLARHGDVDLVIGSVGSAGYDGLELCRQLARLRTPPRSVLITERGAAEDFETGLCTGATMVIACPCRKRMLAARILDLLRSEDHATTQAASLLAQVSEQVAAYWLSVSSRFLPRSSNPTAEIIFV